MIEIYTAIVSQIWKF